MDSSVVWQLWFAWFGRLGGVWKGIREDKVSGYSGPGSGFRMAGGMAVDGEDHVAGMVVDFCIWMGEAVVQQFIGRLFQYISLGSPLLSRLAAFGASVVKAVVRNVL